MRWVTPGQGGIHRGIIRATLDTEWLCIMRTTFDLTLSFSPCRTNEGATCGFRTLFLAAPKSLQMVTVAMNLKDVLLGRKAMTKLDSILKSRDITLPTKVHLVKAMGFPSSLVWMWELDYKESWAPKNWCFWTVVLEKTLESHLNCKEIKPVHPKGDQSWIFIGGTDAKAETPILWPPVTKNWLTGKDPDAGKDWRQEKGSTEDEMVGWHHWLNEHEFE